MPEPRWFSGTVCDIHFHMCCLGFCADMKPGELWGGVSVLHLSSVVATNDLTCICVCSVASEQSILQGLEMRA